MATTMADIMREVGFNKKFMDLFYSCGLISTNIYDEEGELHTDDLKFVKPLFANNPASFEKFFNFISELDANPDFSSIDIQITPNFVVVFYRTPHARVFRRTPQPDPLNYVD